MMIMMIMMMLLLTVWIEPTLAFDLQSPPRTVQQSVHFVLPRRSSSSSVLDITTTRSLNTALSMKKKSSLDDTDNDTFSFLSVDPFFATLWCTLLVFATLVAPGEMKSAQDTALIQSFIEDPLQGFSSSAFYLIFNLLGAIPLVAASVLLPTSRSSNSNQKLPAGPFLASSVALGYFGAGLYLSFFRGVPSALTNNDSENAAWFRPSNLVENKVVNWALVALIGLVFVTSGVVPDLMAHGVNAVGQDYWSMAQDSKFVSVSTADALVYNTALAKGVAQDYQVRLNNNNNNNTSQPGPLSSEAVAVGASTLLLPFVGPALYCALRPPLEKHKTQI